jgi:hypothetical protein
MDYLDSIEVEEFNAPVESDTPDSARVSIQRS